LPPPGRQHQFILVFDLSRVEHQLLSVAYLDSGALHFEQERKFDDIDSHRLTEKPDRSGREIS